MFRATLKPDLDPIERERREIERRRERMAARTSRILDAKNRILGKDADALDSQIRERQERERMEKEQEQYYDDLSQHHSRLLTQAELSKQTQQRQQRAELDAFHRSQTMHKTHKDTMLANDRGLEGADTVFLKFPGEDLDKPLRDKFQQQQQSDWLIQQIAMLQHKQQLQKAEHEEYAATQLQIAELLKELELEKQKERRARHADTLHFNQAMAEHKKAKSQWSSLSEVEANESEISRTLTSPLMTEADTPSMLGPNRKVPYAYKGMTRDERQAILDQQMAQQEEIRLRKEREAEEKRQEAEQQEAVRRLLIKNEREKAQREAQDRLALQAERAQQARDAETRKQHLNDLYSNKVAPSFFDQFGKSSR